MTKRNWNIRQAVEADAPALETCMHAAYQTYSDRIDTTLLPPMTIDYAEEIRTSEVWIAVSDETLVGAVILATDVDQFLIANIAVHPEFQGNGLGRGLIDFAQDQASQRSYPEMHLATHPRLKENISLYAHLGWTEYDRDASHVRMKKNLS